MMRASGSNKNRKISVAGFSRQVEDTQVEISETVLEKIDSRAVAGTLAEISATKKRIKFVNAIKNYFEIDFDYSLGQRVIELSDSNKKSFSNTQNDKAKSLYTAILLLQNKLDNRLDSAEKKEVHL